MMGVSRRSEFGATLDPNVNQPDSSRSRYRHRRRKCYIRDARIICNSNKVLLAVVQFALVRRL